MNYTAQQIAEAKKIVADAEAAERAIKASAARENQAELAKLIADMKTSLRRMGAEGEGRLLHSY